MFWILESVPGCHKIIVSNLSAQERIFPLRKRRKQAVGARQFSVMYTTWFEEYSDDFFTANASDIQERNARTKGRPLDVLRQNLGKEVKIAQVWIQVRLCLQPADDLFGREKNYQLRNLSRCIITRFIC